MRGYRAAKRSGRLAKFTSRVRRATSATVVLGALAAMIESMGGAIGFAQSLKRHLDAAGPGSRQTADVLLALMKIWETVGPEPYDPTKLSDEELRTELDAEILAMIRTNPHRAIAAAAELGWHVTPPTA